jgi:hypothetical protein
LFLGLAAFSARAVTTADGLIELIRTKNVRSVEALLPLLPEEMRAQYVVITHSDSLQSGDEVNPRVMMYHAENTFTRDPKLLAICFSGDASDESFYTVETMEFRNAPPRWEFRQIHFPHKPGLQVMVSKPNPKDCLHCHDTEPRPIWEPYPHWPGVTPAGDKLEEKEIAYLEDFVTRGAKHPRYSQLDRKRNLELNGANDRFRYTLPFDFQIAVSAAERIRVPHVLRGSPDYAKYRYALLAALVDCEKLTDFAPALGGEAKWRKLHHSTERELESLADPHRDLLRFTERGPHVVTHLRYLLEQRGGHVTHLSTSFQDSYFLTATPASTYLEWAKALRAEDPLLSRVAFPADAVEKHLARVSAPWSYGDTEREAVSKLCRVLSAKSRAALR